MEAEVHLQRKLYSFPAGMRRKAPMAVSAANRAVSTSGRTVLRAREEWVLFMKISPVFFFSFCFPFCTGGHGADSLHFACVRFT